MIISYPVVGEYETQDNPIHSDGDINHTDRHISDMGQKSLNTREFDQCQILSFLKIAYFSFYD